MPELPEVETTVRGLARVLDGQRIASVQARRPDLAPGPAGRPRPAADRRARHRPRPPRQIRPDRHRPRRHFGLPSRHVGPLAGRSERDREARPFHHRDRRRSPASRSTTRAGSARSTSCRPTISTAGRRSRRSAPNRSTSTPRTSAPAQRPQGRDQASAARPGIVAGLGNIYVCEALYPRRDPSGARRRIAVARTSEAPGAGDPRRACRSDRGRRVDARAISSAPTASSAISPKRSRSTIARASHAAAAGRSGELSRAAARPSIVRNASIAVSVDLGGLRGRGAPLRCEPAGRAVFH